MGTEGRFLAEPSERSRRGVLVLHAWWGLNDFTRTFCRRLSDEGFVALAASGVRKLEKALRTAGCEAEFHTYPGTTHWFFERDRREAHNAKAARLAWARTLAFLQRHLA